MWAFMSALLLLTMHALAGALESPRAATVMKTVASVPPLPPLLSLDQAMLSLSPVSGGNTEVADYTPPPSTNPVMVFEIFPSPPGIVAFGVESKTGYIYGKSNINGVTTQMREPDIAVSVNIVGYDERGGNEMTFFQSTPKN